MSAPHTTQNGGARSGRLPLLLFWAGVALAPLAALLLWLGSGGGPLKAAAVLAVGSAVLIGLSVVLRRDGEATRIELQETMVTELAAVRAEVANQIAATGDNDVLRHQVGMLSGEVDALRQELVAVRDKQAAHAAPARPEPQPARVVADREPEVQLSTEPVAEDALRDGRLVSAVPEPPQQSRRDRPTNVYRTETVQVTTHTTRVSELAEPELVGAAGGGRTYGARPGYGGTYGSAAGGADLPDAGGNDRVDRWAERLGARAERFGSTGGRLAERLSGARAMRRDRDEDPLADLRASTDSDDLTGADAGADDPWNGLRPDDTFESRRPTGYDASPAFSDPDTPASGTHYRAPTDHAAEPADDFAPRSGTQYGARPAEGRPSTEYGRSGPDSGGRSDADPGGRSGTEYGGRGATEYGSRSSGRAGYDDEDVPRVRAGRRRAELRVTDEWAEISAPGRSDGRTADLVGGHSRDGRTADLVGGRSGGRHGSPDDIDGDWRETSLPGQPARRTTGHGQDDFDTGHGAGHARDDFAGAGGYAGRGGRSGAEPLAITQGDGQARWSQLDESEQAGGRQVQGAGRLAGRQFQGGEQAGGRQFRGGEQVGGRRFQGGEEAAGRSFAGGEHGGGRDYPSGGGRDHRAGGGYQGGSHAAPVSAAGPARPVSPAGPAEARYGRDTSDTHRVGAGGEYGSRHSRRDGSYADESTGSWVDEEETTGGWRSDGQHQSQHPGRHGTAEPRAAAGQYRSAGHQQQPPPGRHQGAEYQARGDGQHQGQPGARYRPEAPEYDERPSRHGRPDTGRW